jgi:glutamate racemase
LNSNSPIGVFDSGFGGLTVLKSIRSLLPSEDIIYLGDTKRAPYGSRSPEQIREFTRDILTFMKRKNVKLAVAACNSITVHLGDLPNEFDFEVIGMSRGLKTAVSLTKANKVGVLATIATVGSNKHKNEAQEMNLAIEIFPKACPEFAQLVEAEQLNGEVVEGYAAEYLTPLKDAGVDTMILACTHYPFLSPVIKKFMPAAHLVDPGVETAELVKESLLKKGLLKSGGQGYDKMYFTADLERVRRMVGHIYDVDKCEIESAAL